MALNSSTEPEKADQPPEEEEQADLTLADLERPECIFHLGGIAARALGLFGTSTFVADDDGSVRYINPVHVFLNDEVARPPPGKVPRLVRPVILEGRPQYLAVKEDGSIWEVEYVDKDEDKK